MTAFLLSERALERLESIGEYTEKQWGIAQRDKYLEALDKRFHDLARLPLLGRHRNDLKMGLHSFQEGKHVIFYVIEDEGISIIDILHEREDVAARREGWN
ncbi:MAG: type II toxin-antitoxin system RelE/ParE family toxin [Alphaproteobacteria bacterium]|nr:type II toxin-antitoxin system RelE/ParE family toxin [Alphaproteobacteria bacterium]